MQKVYLLEPAAASLTPVQISQRGYAHAIFTPDSQLLVINWSRPAEDHDRFQLTVRDRSGQLLANITWPAAAPFVFETLLAALTGGRLAVGSGAELAVWDLPNGRVLGRRTLCPARDHADGPKISLIAANRAGTKLACIAAHTTALRVYDAITLDVLGTIKADAGVTSLSDTLVWSVYGWALLGQRLLLGMNADKLLPEVHFVQQRPGSDCSKVALQLPVSKAPAFSPCGAFCCSFKDTRSTVMQVHDTRTGVLIASQKNPYPHLGMT